MGYPAEHTDTEFKELMEKVEEYDELFKLQHSRVVKADKLWQKAFKKPHIWPDLGVLVDWLMESRSRAVKNLDKYGCHKAGCKVYHGDPKKCCAPGAKSRKCTCGLDDALKG
jgi:hypothetical protein